MNREKDAGNARSAPPNHALNRVSKIVHAKRHRRFACRAWTRRNDALNKPNRVHRGCRKAATTSAVRTGAI